MDKNRVLDLKHFVNTESSAFKLRYHTTGNRDPTISYLEEDGVHAAPKGKFSSIVKINLFYH
jgi:hypothetical protein